MNKRSRISQINELILRVPVLHSVLSLPPRENRPETSWLIKNFVYYYYDKSSDETHIYYRVFWIAIAASLLLLLAYLVAQILGQDIDLFAVVVRYNPHRPVDEFVYNYPRQMAGIIFSIVPIYAISLSVLATDILTESRIRSETKPTHHSYKELYTTKPTKFLLLMFLATLIAVYAFGVPHYLRSYSVFELIRDFGAQDATNFIIFASLYIAFFVLVYAQFMAVASIHLVRSIIKFHILK